MPEREFGIWRAYWQKHSFPYRKQEFYLAQIAMLIARTMGGAENVSIQDYLFDPERQQTTEAAEIALMEEESFR